MSTEGFQYRALYMYKKEREEDIDLLPGDILTVSKGAFLALGCKEGDEEIPNLIGWIPGINQRTKQKGDFPGTYVEYLGPVKISLPVHKPRLQRPLPAAPGTGITRPESSSELHGPSLPDLTEQFSPPDTAPPILIKLVEIIEKKGLNNELLYRTSGSPSGSEIQQAVQTGLGVELDQFDALSVSEVLKGYLQDLPSPVIPITVHGKLLSTVQGIPEYKRCREQLSQILQSPSIHLQNSLTLQYLLQHLANVCRNTEKNGLTLHLVAEIFAPLLFKLPPAGTQ
nr:PREDICTED: phosphatidylinositol 3-kinase regulatory subunit alpha-like [Latimeria chalumnae]|eukprot:XP_006013384.2 PREDICTED: phosphatidylinositol 3-kinase regulatory subunit alpha-like [Latimeria chalumnae]